MGSPKVPFLFPLLGLSIQVFCLYNRAVQSEVRVEYIAWYRQEFGCVVLKKITRHPVVWKTFVL